MLLYARLSRLNKPGMEVEIMVDEKKSAGGMSDDSKLFGALAYLVGILSGILVFLLKKDDKYAKFHAMQSILLGVAVFVIFVALTIVGVVVGFVPVIGWVIGLLLGLLYLVVWLGLFILWLLLMWKAYNGEKWKLPVIGEHAEKMSS